MKWKGKLLKTIDDLMRHGIDACLSEEEAQQFIMEYVVENPHARDNIGYLAGYYNNADKHRIFKWFDVVHPIFGTKELPNDELMRIGIKMGQRMAKKNKDEDEPLDVGEFIRANITIAGTLMKDKK